MRLPAAFFVLLSGSRWLPECCGRSDEGVGRGPGGPPHKYASLCCTRLPAAFLALVLSACAPTPPPQTVHKDETEEPWYNQTVQELAAQNRKAATLWKSGKPDDAAALIQSGEPIASRLLAVTRPTLAAMQDASDLDDLYGQMLLSNKNYGWARLFFQKNLARWKTWKPQTPDTAVRFKQAQDAIAECDRLMSEH